MYDRNADPRGDFVYSVGGVSRLALIVSYNFEYIQFR